MIKVLHILTDSNIGGAGRCLINYLQYYNKSRFDVKVVLPKNSKLIPEVEQYIPVIAADNIAETSFSFASLKVLKQIIRAEAPDIVHTHGSLSGRVAAKQLGAKVVYTRHSAFPVPRYLKSGLGHRLYGLINAHYADRIIAISPACQQNLLDSGVPGEKIVVMMNGAAPIPRLSDLRRRELRQTLQLPESCFVGGILARLEPYKGHMLLLAAAKSLMDAGREFRFLIGGSGPEEGKLRAKIQELGLTNHVFMLGFVEDVSEILNILDVQINCSWGTEASSLSLIEGMSLGLATVASDYGGNPWQIEDGKTGLLFPSGDSDALRDCLQRLMDEPELLMELKKNALEAYQSEFTGEIFADNVEKVYNQILYRK